MKFCAGSKVLYKNNGVCEIERIETKVFGDTGEVPYYVVRPLTGSSTIFVPVASESAGLIRALPTKDDVLNIIRTAEECVIQPIENSKLRIAFFDRILAEGDRAKILKLHHFLSEKADCERKRNKSLCSNEARILSTCEKIIRNEVSVACGISEDEVFSFIDEVQK